MRALQPTRASSLALTLLLLGCGGTPIASTTGDDDATVLGDASDAAGETDAVVTLDADALDGEAATCADLGVACATDAACCSGVCGKSVGVCLAGRCGLPSTKCANAADCCSASCVGGVCQVVDVAPIADGRDRLLDTFATVQAKSDRCAAWSALDDVQKGLFLTHTDMLGNRSCMENASITSSAIGASGNCSATDGCRCAAGTAMALDHVFKLWAIEGSDPTCSCTETATGYNCCNGGADWHRIFFTADDRLIDHLRDVNGGLPEWGASTDLGGPHAPFTQSDETTTGQPRGQTHFWSKDSEASTLMRVGVTGVLEPHIVELDNDYNLPHDSNPEGCYGFFGLACTYGRAAFKALWSDRGNQATTTFRGNGEPSAIAELSGDAVFAPRCPTAHVDRVTGAAVARGAVVTLEGTGFADCAAHVGCGNVVHLRTHAREIVIGQGSPFDRAEGATAVTVQIPEECTVGEAYVWVVTSGIASNLLPITIAK